MSDFAGSLGASRSLASLLVLLIPSKDRFSQPIDQAYWVDQALAVLGSLFGGATAFPRGKGIWRDDAQGGKLLLDKTVVIHCYTSIPALEHHASALKDFLHRFGREARQGAIGLVIDRQYLEIAFPLERPRKPVGRRGKKQE